MAGDRDKLRLLADYYRIRADKYKVLGSLLQSKSTFVISGYVLERDVDRVVAVLNEKFSLMADVYDVPEDESGTYTASESEDVRIGGGRTGVIWTSGKR